MSENNNPPASESTSPPASMDELFDQAENALNELQHESALPQETEKPVDINRILSVVGSQDGAVNLDAVRDIELDVRIVLGEAELTMEEVMRLRKGSVVTLDAKNNDPVSIVVNGQVIAKGEVLERGGKYCIRLLEIMGNK